MQPTSAAGASRVRFCTEYKPIPTGFSADWYFECPTAWQRGLAGTETCARHKSDASAGTNRGRCPSHAPHHALDALHLHQRRRTPRTDSAHDTTVGEQMRSCIPDRLHPAPTTGSRLQRKSPDRNFKILTPGPDHFDGDGNGIGRET